MSSRKQRRKGWVPVTHAPRARAEQLTVDPHRATAPPAASRRSPIDGDINLWISLWTNRKATAPQPAVLSPPLDPREKAIPPPRAGPRSVALRKKMPTIFSAIGGTERSCSGGWVARVRKSTLASVLATELGVALLSEDAIKEALMDALGAPAPVRPVTSSVRRFRLITALPQTTPYPVGQTRCRAGCPPPQGCARPA